MKKLTKVTLVRLASRSNVGPVPALSITASKKLKQKIKRVKTATPQDMEN